MNILELLAPVIIGLCGSNFVNGQGDYCNPRQSKPSVVKYYEPGKSCYKNGVFYEKCENSPPVKY